MKKINLHFNMTRKEMVMAVVQGAVEIGVVAILFYNHIFAMVLLSPYLYYFMRKKEKQLEAKKNSAIGSQFKDGMLAISASLAVGYSVENAFGEAVRELESLYGKNAILVGEFREIEKRISLNENVEDAIEKMAKKIRLEEAIYFAEVFRYAKRSGGNLIEIIKKTAQNISAKMEVKEDIEVVISGKKMEQKVMNLMPFGIIAYLRFGAAEFVEPLYGNLIGIVAMTACLAGYFGARILAEKITDITV